MYSVEWQIINWTGCGMRRHWPTLGQYPSTLLDGQGKPREDLRVAGLWVEIPNISFLASTSPNLNVIISTTPLFLTMF
jgi:hypothetical protein